MFAFLKRPHRDRPRAARAPEGERIYAIGDIHGRRDLLDALMRKIEDDAIAYDGAVRYVFLGDYVDRGPQSREVVSRLIEIQAQTPNAEFLRGNHEDAMLGALSDDDMARRWIGFGGDKTLASYGVDLGHYTGGEAGIREIIHEFRTRLPEDHREFLERLPVKTSYGDYFFVHAGVRPGVPLDAQDPEDLMWIRGEFHKARARPEKVIVHGHCPVIDPDDQGWRINVDTGACFSDVLTSVVLEGDARRFLQTARGR